MELNAYKTEKITVEVDERELFRILETKLRNRHRLFRDFRVDDKGHLIETVDMQGRGSDFEKDHGVASELQKQCQIAIDVLRATLNLR